MHSVAKEDLIDVSYYISQNRVSRLILNSEQIRWEFLIPKVLKI